MFYKEEILNMLDEKGIAYEKMEHPAVFTMEEMDALGITEKGFVCKNLFLRDAKGKTHFLLSMPEEKKVSLKEMAAPLETDKLSFASAQRLEKYLGLKTGAVSPFGVWNDTENKVIVILDEELMAQEKIGVHPNDNTATVWIAPKTLCDLIEEKGNECRVVKL